MTLQAAAKLLAVAHELQIVQCPGLAEDGDRRTAGLTQTKNPLNA
jgi:hypothetical protein